MRDAGSSVPIFIFKRWLMSTSRALQDLRGDREEDEGGEVDRLADYCYSSQKIVSCRQSSMYVMSYLVTHHDI